MSGGERITIKEINIEIEPVDGSAYGRSCIRIMFYPMISVEVNGQVIASVGKLPFDGGNAGYDSVRSATNDVFKWIINEIDRREITDKAVDKL